MLVECSHLRPAAGRGSLPSEVGGVRSTGHEITGNALHGLQVPLLCGQGPSSLENSLLQVSITNLANYLNQLLYNKIEKLRQ